LFKEVPFWLNLNEESIVSNTITSSARGNRFSLFDSVLPTDRTHNFDTKRSVFNNDQSIKKGGGDLTQRGFLHGRTQNTFETSHIQDTSRFNTAKHDHNTSRLSDNEIELTKAISKKYVASS